jgi:hypothetical protein
LHWIIRSKKGLQATILTGHNHDNYYIRYDINHTTAGGAARTLTDADRAQFRTNAKVLRRDADDTFHGTLTVTGNINIQGLGGADSIDAVVAGGVSADYYVGNRLFINESARISLSGGNSLMITGSNTCNVRMYPALNYGLTGTTKLYDQSQRDADSRNLVIDYKTGEVSCRPMHNVSSSAPPTSTAGYPEGFVWYQTGGATASTISSATQNGYTELPGGILMQWGFVSVTEMINQNSNLRKEVLFPRPFSTTPWSINVTPYYSSYNGAGDSFGQVAAWSASKATIILGKGPDGNTVNLSGAMWTAIGKK